MAEDKGKDKDKTPKSDINFEYSVGSSGLNMDSVPSQISKGSLTYALNTSLENFDSNSVTYQNEPGNELCLNLPHNYIVMGRYLITEQAKLIFFLSNPATGDSEIGYMVNNDCIYHTIINSKCLNFDVNFPIHKVVHKTSNCGTEIYWAQPNDDRKYLNLDKVPYLPRLGSTPCDETLTNQLDCNQLRVQPNFSIPKILVKDVIIGGNLIAGVYQFAFQYSDALGNPLSSYYSITNPTPIADPQFATVDFNYPVGKTIVLNISDIEIGGQFDFFNLAVIKTINGIYSVDLVGTYGIEGTNRVINYTGQNLTNINLTINNIFEKFPFYGPADDVTTSQDVLIWKGVATPQRINYQKIATQITLQWETWRIPSTENYANELNATHLRGYLRDEIYPFEIVFLLRSGQQTDGFHIPGRALTTAENTLPEISPANDDYIEDPKMGPIPYWRNYNTATDLGFSGGYKTTDDYKGPYKYGDFAYWESFETYPCDKEMWGDLAEKRIRHHKFPDVAISPIIESKTFGDEAGLTMGNDAIFPIGVKVNIDQIRLLVGASDLTPEQKADIVGFKIVRGDRTDNRSIVGKGILRNVNKYKRDEEDFYFANYPYNDLTPDPFLNSVNNAYAQIAKPWLIICIEDGDFEYGDPNTNKPAPLQTMKKDQTYEVCSTTRPVTVNGRASIGPADYDVYRTFATGSRGFALTWHDPFTEDNTIVTDRRQFLHTYSYIPGTADDNVYARVAVGDRPDTGNCNENIAISLPFVGVCGERTEQQRTTIQAKDIVDFGGGTLDFPHIGRRTTVSCLGETPLPPISADKSLALRQVFNSPETSFGQPFLGDILKLESVIYGRGVAHFVEVKDNAKYRLISKEAQQDALKSAGKIAEGDTTAIFTAYQAYIQVYINGITRKNYAYSYNSIADYNYTVPVPDNMGVKQRTLDLKRYLIPVVQSEEKDIVINNFQRETSVYLKTDDAKTPLPFPDSSPNMLVNGVPKLIEHSRFTLGCDRGPNCPVTGNITSTTTTTSTTTIVPKFCPGSCATPQEKQNISVVSYYASLKNTFRSQWGQIYTYQTIDTGYQVDLFSDVQQSTTVFGGDTFICRFGFKTKLPFFIDNRVNAPDDSDVFYDEIGNIAYPKYWHSSRSILEDFAATGAGFLTNIISYKAHNFDCPNCQAVPPGNSNRTFYDGYYYLFAYGIPNFYVETGYNIDLRQAFNDREGDFWPHVTNSIPDDWVQESWTSIANDNTYYYNTSFSKQNKENFFSHIPANFQFKTCEFTYPFRAIYSDPQVSTADTTVNNWLTYRGASYFDFPQNHGRLVSLDGITRGQVLARFENKSLLYNALYTTQTNTSGQIYLGQPLFDRRTPPYDYAETDLGFIGSQHKFILKTPQGQISCDAKRGQVFLMNGTDGVKDLSAPGSGMNRFFTDHLAFEILRYFPHIEIDNHFNSIGLHGVYDSKFDRVIITKLDYIPLLPNIKYDPLTKEFYLEEIVINTPPSTTTSSTTGLTVTITTTLSTTTLRKRVLLSDPDYFCNKSWTLSYSMITNNWLSFHSYLPNWYVGENNFYYSGKKGCCSDFDFTFLVGELVPNPPTTTTTSSSTTSTSSTTTTTTTRACNLDGGIVTLPSCNLAGTAVITVPPVVPPCVRPLGLTTSFFVTGYTILPSTVIVSTGSHADACSAVTYFIGNITGFSLQTIVIQYASLTVGSIVYDGNTPGCGVIPDGWYWNDESANLFSVFNVVGGIIREVSSCFSTTTTTTSILCPAYIYAIDIYTCGGCVSVETGSISNITPLSIGSWYFDSVTNSKIKIASFTSCTLPTGATRSILDSSGQDFCADVFCIPKEF